MLRAAHYKADAVDGPGVGKSPHKHRSGGILDLALTAADKYALSLLPAALKGTGFVGNDGALANYGSAPQRPPNSLTPASKLQRPAGLHSTQAQPLEVKLQLGVDSRVASSWDASLKEILAALEPETRTLKPAKLRDHKYPNQNHGMPTHTVVPSPRRELDEALITVPVGPRRGKSSLPAYTNVLKGASRQSRKPELQAAPHSAPVQAVDVQYDLVPSVKLAWAGPGTGTYSTTGFGGSPKKYTSQLVGRVSPHYVGTPALAGSLSMPASTQDALHLPEIGNSNSNSAAHQQDIFKSRGHVLPNLQSWTNTTAPANAAGNSRRALPYVSPNAPSLAKPLTVQYHPVLKSPSLGAPTGFQYAEPSGTASPAGSGLLIAPQRPATDQGSSVQPTADGADARESTRLYPHSAYGGQPQRLPQTPTEVAVEVARLRHAQELDGVINGVRSDLMQVSVPRFDAPAKSKFLRLYEDPNRPLTKLNPKQLLRDAPLPSHQHQRRHPPPNLSTEKPQISMDGRPPSSTISTASRSPMYERRLRPLPSASQMEEPDRGAAALEGHGLGSLADGNALGNVHLQPPEIPDDQSVDRMRVGQLVVEREVERLQQSTHTSSVLDREVAALAIAHVREPSNTAEGSRAAEGDAEPNEPFSVGAVQEAAAGAVTEVPGAFLPSSNCSVGAGEGGDAEVGATVEELDGPPAAQAQDLVGLAGSCGLTEQPEPPGGWRQEFVQQEMEEAQPEESGVSATGVADWGLQDVSPTQADPTLQQPTEAYSEQGQLCSSQSGGTASMMQTCQELPVQAVAGTLPVDRPPSSSQEQMCGDGPRETGENVDETSEAVRLDVSASVDPSGLAAGPPPGAEGYQAANACAQGVVPDREDASRPYPDCAQEQESLSAAVPSSNVDSASPQDVIQLGDLADAPRPASTTAASMNADVVAEGAAVSMDGEVAVGDVQGPSGDAGKLSAESRDVQPSLGDTDSPAAPEPDVTVSLNPPGYTLPPGVTPDMARASAICIQSHARGYQARRHVMAKQKARVAAQSQQHCLEAEAPASPSQPKCKQLSYELPLDVTPEMAHVAIVRIQSHARGYFARRQVAELRRGREAGEAALSTAVTGVAMRKLEAYELKAGVTAEMAEAAAIRVQAHMRGHLARRHVRCMRIELSPTAEVSAVEVVAEPDTQGEVQAALGPAEADTTLREEGGAVSSGVGIENAGQLAPTRTEPEEFTMDALNAAIADEDEDETDAEGGTLSPKAAGPEGPTALDLSDPAAVAAAAAAAKGAVRLLEDGGYQLETVADTTAAADQALDETIMARLAAKSTRTSTMFQRAGAEMRFSDDEASALELMDNLDGLLQGDDEAAAAAAAVAAATARTDGEIVSISAEGVSEPQSLGGSIGTGAPANPMDVTEPGGVRVLAGKYEVQHVVGEGAYGMVMKCKVRGTEPIHWVAIKEFKIDDNDPDAEDVKRTSLREVAVLEALQHPHVVGFVDKFMVGDRLFIVMEFLPCNLLELLEAQPSGMDRDAVRLIMFQLCSAIAFIHSKGMVYRDIKPENLLVDEHGTVKLCDFGFARYMPSSPSSHLTDYVATRWYRAPELLLGPPYRDAMGKHIQYLYGPLVDMWAVGCLMGELLDGEPLFAGDSDLDQLYRVQQIMGPMAHSHQYMFYANPHNTGIVFNIKQPMTLSARYRGKVSDVELSFMSGLLEMDPDKRLTGEQCLQHPYLVDLATAASALPTPTPTDSNNATSTNLPADDSSGKASALDVETAGTQAAATATEKGKGEGLHSSREASTRGSLDSGALPGVRVGDSRAGLEGHGLEKAGSLTRAVGSLTRGGRSLSRGSISPVQTQPMFGSSVAGPGPQRAASKLQASENGHVVIVEGLDEGDEVESEETRPVGNMAEVRSISALVDVAPRATEIEPLE